MKNGTDADTVIYFESSQHHMHAAATAAFLCT
jgi:hypothetical protein